MLTQTTVPEPVPARVLLVDDDDFMTVNVSHYLTRRGCDVVTARDPHAAEHELTRATYDLVVIDPYMTGQTTRDTRPLLLKMRDLQPRAAFVLISAYTSPEMVGAASACSAIAVLTKPQSPQFLSELVLSALESQSQMEPNQ